VAELSFAAQVAAAAEEMRRKATNKEVRTETLPPEDRTLIDKMVADLQKMHQRLEQAEAFQSALIREATSKLKGAA